MNMHDKMTVKELTRTVGCILSKGRVTIKTGLLVIKYMDLLKYTPNHIDLLAMYGLGDLMTEKKKMELSIGIAAELVDSDWMRRRQ